MAQHERRPPPLEAVGLEAEALEWRRRRGQRIEGAEPVVGEARFGELAATHRAARVGVGLEHDHVPARVGQHIGGDEPVGPAPDHDRVGVGHRGSLPRPVEHRRYRSTL
jgi:hypothetical protein